MRYRITQAPVNKVKTVGTDKLICRARKATLEIRQKSKCGVLSTYIATTHYHISCFLFFGLVPPRQKARIRTFYFHLERSQIGADSCFFCVMGDVVTGCVCMRGNGVEMGLESSDW